MNYIDTLKPTERFTDIAETFYQYRPHYPVQVIDILDKFYGFKNMNSIADIGSGTGIFTKQFMELGKIVFGVEPNDKMRKKSENDFSAFSNFKAINGTAENTQLANNSIDLITAAQSFHWFDTKSAISEFYRILIPEGIILLIWNERKNSETILMSKYEKVLRKYCVDYKETNHNLFTFPIIKGLFKDKNIDLYMLNNHQYMDLESFIGRVRSCSYCPKPQDRNFAPLMGSLKDIFDIHHSDNKIRFDYNTVMYIISE